MELELTSPWNNRRVYFQFSSVQLLSLVWLFGTPWTAGFQALLFFTISQFAQFMFFESVILSNQQDADTVKWVFKEHLVPCLAWRISTTTSHPSKGKDHCFPALLRQCGNMLISSEMSCRYQGHLWRGLSLSCLVQSSIYFFSFSTSLLRDKW